MSDLSDDSSTTSFNNFSEEELKFIKGFSKIAKPLNKLLQKDEPYMWTSDQNEAFLTLKEHLISAPILRYPDFQEPTGETVLNMEIRT
ncbi:15881_t:CDS:2 [Gigaspora rosea]|nr:15881_t:CDS:2 [Gigaspora rosea]